MTTAKRDYREGDWVRFSVPNSEAVGQISSVQTPNLDSWERDPLSRSRDRRTHYVVRQPNGECTRIPDHMVIGVADVVAAVAALAIRPLSLRFRFRVLGDHVHATLFVGKPHFTLANSGKLVFRTDEWGSFVAAMQLVGQISQQVDVDFVSEEVEVET